MEFQLFAYAAISITFGRAFTAIAICIVVMGKVFTVFLIVKIDYVVTFAFTTTKTIVDCLITRMGGTNRQGLARVAAPPLRVPASSSGSEQSHMCDYNQRWQGRD